MKKLQILRSKEAKVGGDQEEASHLKQALLEAGFRSLGTGTRRGIYEDLRGENPRFSPGYRPTLAEIYRKKYGDDNWGVVSTGSSTEDSDPWGVEPADVTDWQNRQYEIFVRNPDESAQTGAKSFFDIQQAELATRAAIATVAIKPAQE